MFKKILVANRGEIAVRVIRTAKEMGISTVAVYSELDRNALHVKLADEAFALGGVTAAQSYLNTEKLLKAIRTSGADAVHPGYGFYSENADFARAVRLTGVAFIGPPPDAIEIMGDKISSRIAAAKAGVKGVPGTSEIITSPTQVIDFGNEHGWPVAIKAAYGGGGRGMRVVKDAASASEALDSAQREALNAFGRDESYLERYLTWPRHIEMQILCDSHGNALWLGERDCSCQRRHQKLIEESPAPGLSERTRKAMGEAAVKVARACGYVNAGTVEFLYQDDQFYFLEMNTRLQVEHPVTEMVTSLDLVEMQIRIAAGEPIGFSQKEVVSRGHAIECRINAENPNEGKFLPSPGRITKFVAPSGFATRLDAGYTTGDSVSQYYDNLIAKLIVWGKDRESARHRMLRALSEIEIEGVATTIPAQQILLSHVDFIEAKHSTNWVEQGSGLGDLRVEPKGAAVAQQDDVIPRQLIAEVNGKRVEVTLFVPSEIANSSASGSQFMSTKRGGGSASTKPRAALRTTTSGTGKITVPMQGTIVKILVSLGDKVEQGATVCILEAMKMENAIVADKSGEITEIKVSPGDSVGTGDIVVVIS